MCVCGGGGGGGMLKKLKETRSGRLHPWKYYNWRPSGCSGKEKDL